jgi:hypothetical protein
MNQDLYKILQVDPFADPQEIVIAYQTLVNCYSPEASSHPQAAVRLKAVHAAYEVLGDPEKRDAYDIRNGWKLSPSLGQAPEAEKTIPPGAATPRAETLSSSVPERTPIRMGVCECCRMVAPTRRVKFRENIAAFLLRYPKEVDGNLCRDCIEAYFWSMTGKTLLFGWWGLISCCVAPIYLIGNIVTYLGAAGLPRSPVARKPRLSAWKIIVIGVVLMIAIVVGMLLIKPA